MIVGTIGYFLYRRHHGLDPKKQYRIPRPERPVGFVEVAYHSALVPILGTSVDNEAMARAAKLVGPDAAVEAVYVLKVPEQLPLDGGLEREEREARRVLEVARLQAKVAGCRVRCRLLRTRNPGRAIVDEAKERRSDLIYISTEHAPSEERLIGPTIRYVMANRPCRVIVEHDPTAAAASMNGNGKAKDNGAVPVSAVPSQKALDPR
jgi:APA family basic amino acid/polyamine antiporter